MSEKPTLMLLDGNSLAYRAFYALPAENFKTTGGLTTNAVYGFTAMLINLLRDEQPTHIAAAFDVSRQTFRSERLPGVQGHPHCDARRVPRPDRHHQGSAGSAGHHRARRPGFEADDIIATLATQAGGRGHTGPGRHRRPRRAATGQRRRHRAVPDQGRQRADPLHPGGRRREVRTDPRAVSRLRRAARRPERQPARHPGVGEKTAAKWIVEYGSLQATGRQRRQVKGKVGDSLRENLASVLLNREAHPTAARRATGPDPR